MAVVEDLLQGSKMRYEVTLEAIVGGMSASEDAVDESLAAVMEALVDMGVEDPFVGGAGSTRRYEITIVIDAPSENDAFARGRALIGDAINRAGASIAPLTNSQPAASSFAWTSTSVRPAVA